jgi:tripartite-type tricarboxylate transporter receptor subunit TctC
MKRLAGFAVAALMAVAGPASAQEDWPSKPVKLVVPFNAGGTSDQVGRTLANAIMENEFLPEPITIVNVGGHFSIGSRRVMEADPDGYEFLLIHIAIMGGEGTGALDFGWRDFKPVVATGEFCVMPMVRKDSGINSMEELLAKAKAEPDSLIFGANLGAINHLAGLMIQEAEPGAKFRFVQIGGGTANFTALTGDQTDTTVLSGAEVINFTRLPDGSENPEAQIKPLAYTGGERFEGLADVPTMKELGYDVEFCIKSWIFAPKDTPDAVVSAFADALEQATSTDAYKKFTDSKGFANVFLRGEALQADLDTTWQAIEPIAQLAKQK